MRAAQKKSINISCSERSSFQMLQGPQTEIITLMASKTLTWKKFWTMVLQVHTLQTITQQKRGNEGFLNICVYIYIYVYNTYRYIHIYYVTCNPHPVTVSDKYRFRFGFPTNYLITLVVTGILEKKSSKSSCEDVPSRLSKGPTKIRCDIDIHPFGFPTTGEDTGSGVKGGPSSVTNWALRSAGGWRF